MSEHWIDANPNLSARRKRNWRKTIWWMICPVLCVVLFIYLFLKQGLLSGLTAQELLRTACDACFVCGLIFASLFVIGLCAYWGAFDFLGYSGGLLFNALFRGRDCKSEEKRANFADYVQKKSGCRRINKACLTYAVGCLLAGTILLILYLE